MRNPSCFVSGERIEGFRWRSTILRADLGDGLRACGAEATGSRELIRPALPLTEAAAGMEAAAAGTGAEAATDDATVDAAEEAEVVAAVACPAEEEVRVEAEERAAPRRQPDS